MRARTWKLHSWGMLDREKRRDLIGDRFRSITDHTIHPAFSSSLRLLNDRYTVLDSLYRGVVRIRIHLFDLCLNDYKNS